LLYEMLSGHVPFRGDTEWQLMKAQIDEPPKPLRELVTVPDTLDAAVMKALEKQPERRFQTAAEFHFALEVAARQAGFLTDAVTSGAGAPTPPPGHITAHAGPAPGVQSWEETRVAVPTPVPIARPGSGAIPPPRVDAETRLSTDKPATTPPAAHALPPAPVPVSRAAVPPVAKPQVLKRRQRWPTFAFGTLAILALAGGLAWLVWWRQAATPDTALPPPHSVAEQVPAAAVASGAAGPVETPGTVETPGPADMPPQATVPPKPAPPAQPAPRPSAAASPRRPGAGTTSATPRPGETRDVVPPAVPPPARGELAKPAPPPAGAVAGTLIFHNVRLVRPGSPELEIELHFEPARMLIMDKTGQRILRGVPFALIGSAEYVEARRRVFVRTLRHFLVLRGPQGEVARLRLERENAAEVVSSFEERWGKTVTRSAPQDEERP
jgi:serine/threonine-protein kinase